MMMARITTMPMIRAIIFPFFCLMLSSTAMLPKFKLPFRRKGIRQVTQTQIINFEQACASEFLFFRYLSLFSHIDHIPVEGTISYDDLIFDGIARIFQHGVHDLTFCFGR